MEKLILTYNQVDLDIKSLAEEILTISRVNMLVFMKDLKMFLDMEQNGIIDAFLME